jgi:hypothetical protein
MAKAIDDYTDCCRCKEEIGGPVYDKLPGPMCRNCAQCYELELMAQIEEEYSPSALYR